MDFLRLNENISPRPTINVGGIAVFKGFLPITDQTKIVEDLRHVVEKAPTFSPKTKFGKKMSVKLTAAGEFGWFSDHRGYRYEKRHPSGVSWPEIPSSILSIWRFLASQAPSPQCCLVNYYEKDARMGMHQDRDEANFEWPVVSISLGDDALLRVGGPTKGGKTSSVWLQSGDIAVMGGDARLNFHGIDRIKFKSSNLLKKGGRLNVTLRVVT